MSHDSQRPNAVHIAIARRLVTTGRARDIRQAAGLSHGEIAQHLGCSRDTVCNWERGRSKVPGQHATAYITLLRDLQAMQGTSRPGDAAQDPMTAGAGT